MKLAQARELIEHGRTAKVEYYLRSPNYLHEVLLQQQGEYLHAQLNIYLMQNGREQWLFSRSSTRCIDWQEVLSLLDGAAVHSTEWAIVDAPLATFPPGAEDQQTPPTPFLP